MAQLVTKEALDQMATLQKGYIDAKFQAAAPKFTVGYGLSLSEAGELSVTLDTSISKIVTELPATPAEADKNKIFMVLSAQSETGNTYVEYIWVVSSNSWEKIGEFKPAVDLTPYLKIADLTSKVDASSLEILKGTTQVAKFVIGDTLAGAFTGKVLTLNMKEVVAAKAAGFYKVAFDKYGRITGATAVAEADITGLGFSTTAGMTQAINAAVAAETSARETSEQAINKAIQDETKARTDNDATLSTAIQAANGKIEALEAIENNRSLLTVDETEALYHTIYG